jgi:Bacterial low temperature requirement A protein (LtrA)
MRLFRSRAEPSCSDRTPGKAARGSSSRAPAQVAAGGNRAGRPENPAEDERGSFPVELLWDLVFAFALTQVTTLFAHRATWLEFGQAMLVLALIWWAWSAFVWAANAQEADTHTLRPTLLAAAVLIFVCGLALPQAFGREGLLFAGTYGIVRLLHLGLHADAARKGNASWAPIARFATTVLVGIALLVVGSLLPPSPRLWFWAAAVAIDYAGPGWFARPRLRDLQHVAVSHFAERYGAFVIICIGNRSSRSGLALEPPSVLCRWRSCWARRWGWSSPRPCGGRISIASLTRLENGFVDTPSPWSSPPMPMPICTCCSSLA